jgi:hypothetical protein
MVRRICHGQHGATTLGLANYLGLPFLRSMLSINSDLRNVEAKTLC